MIENVIGFINDPANTLMLYLFAGGLILLGLFVLISLKRFSSGEFGGDVHIGGNNSGVVNTGQIKGDINVAGSSQASKPHWAVTLLDIAAKLAAVLGFLLAVWIFVAGKVHV